MKIGIIGHKRVPLREGGVEAVVCELSKRFTEKGHEIVIYNRKTLNQGSSIVEYYGAKIRNIFTFNSPILNAFVYSVSATIQALRDGADVIHYHAEGPGAMCLLAKCFHIPAVVTVHGLDWRRSKWGRLASCYLKFGESIAAKYADEIIVLSENAREYFKDKYNRETKLIRNGADICEPVKPKLIYSLGLAPGEYILFLARIVPEKGLHYLIEAFKEIETDKKLVIAGKLWERDGYTKRIINEAQGDSRIMFIGFAEGRLLGEIYSNCLVYILPSEVEGMALSLIEALSYGARCLVSDIPENLCVAEEYVLSFKCGSVSSLRERLSELIKSEYGEEERLRQMEYMREHYSWDRCASETLEVLERAMSSR